MRWACALLLFAAAAFCGLSCSSDTITALPTSAAAGEPLPAFPGAEGFGASTPGGRGGRIIRVTNLNPDGPGSLQAACRERGPRIIVFAVSGVIHGDI